MWIKMAVLAVLASAPVAAWLSLSAPAPKLPLSAVFEQGEAFDFTPPQPGSYPLYRIKAAPDGDVLDRHGATQQLSQITAGKLSLVSFVYLNCGDTSGCPLALSTLFEIHDASAKLPQLKEKLQLVTISFDPLRDTVEAIDSFAHPITTDPDAAQKIDWHVFTTSGQDALRPILNGYGQVVDPTPDTDQISHVLRIFLVDGAGQVRNIYGLGLIDPRLLMTDVETLLMEEGVF